MPPLPEGENRHQFKTSVTSVKYDYGPWGRRHRGRSSSCCSHGSWVMVEDPISDGDESSEGEPDIELAQFFATPTDSFSDKAASVKVSIEPVPKPQNADVSTAASEGLGTRLCAESSESHNTRDGLAGEGGVQAEGDHQEDGEDTRKERSSGHCSITNHGEDPTSLRFYSVDSIENLVGL